MTRQPARRPRGPRDPRVTPVVARVPDRQAEVVFLCELADSDVTGQTPVLADRLLHTPLAWIHSHLGIDALPGRIGLVVRHLPLPVGVRFTVTVEDIHRTDYGACCSVTATDVAGNLLVELLDVELVCR